MNDKLKKSSSDELAQRLRAEAGEEPAFSEALHQRTMKQVLAAAIAAPARRAGGHAPLIWATLAAAAMIVIGFAVWMSNVASIAPRVGPQVARHSPAPASNSPSPAPTVAVAPRPIPSITSVHEAIVNSAAPLSTDIARAGYEPVVRDVRRLGTFFIQQLDIAPDPRRL